MMDKILTVRPPLSSGFSHSGGSCSKLLSENRLARSPSSRYRSSCAYGGGSNVATLWLEPSRMKVFSRETEDPALGSATVSPSLSSMFLNTTPIARLPSGFTFRLLEEEDIAAGLWAVGDGDAEKKSVLFDKSKWLDLNSAEYYQL